MVCVPSAATVPNGSILIELAFVAFQFTFALPCSITLSPMRRYRTSAGDASIELWISGLTATLVDDFTTPPGPEATISYVVVFFGCTDRSPLGSACFKVSASAVITLCTVSEVCQATREESPQLICAGVALMLPLTGATATDALAFPAVKRGSELMAAPSGQGLTFCLPLATFRTIR